MFDSDVLTGSYGLLLFEKSLLVISSLFLCEFFSFYEIASTKWWLGGNSNDPAFYSHFCDVVRHFQQAKIKVGYNYHPYHPYLTVSHLKLAPFFFATIPIGQAQGETLSDFEELPKSILL